MGRLRFDTRARRLKLDRGAERSRSLSRVETEILMRYWVLSVNGKDARGPFEVAELKSFSNFGPESVVAPDDAKSPDAWRPTGKYD